ncbi:MAG: hypothetical protein R2879_16480 [Saprospiraceae bacterium]|jgi:hypothetical protein
MFDYKVEYLPTSHYKKKWYMNKVDGLKLAKELEAMLIEYDEKGYELLKMDSIVTTEPSTAQTSTDGMLLVFKKKQDQTV